MHISVDLSDQISYIFIYNWAVHGDPAERELATYDDFFAFHTTNAILRTRSMERMVSKAGQYSSGYNDQNELSRSLVDRDTSRWCTAKKSSTAHAY